MAATGESSTPSHFDYEDYEELLTKQRKETKELRGKIQALKKGIPKGDRKKKKEICAEIVLLQQELESRHSAEVSAFSQFLLANNQGLEGKDEVLEGERKGEGEDDAGVVKTNALTNGDGEKVGAGKKSRAQKRKAKKAQQEREKAQRMAEMEAEEASNVSSRQLEREKLNSILTPLGLAIRDITPDGHCLYAAVSDQLSVHMKIKVSVAELRNQCGDYIHANSSEFLPYLTHPDTGNQFTQEQFDEYCREVVETAAWGGQLEIRAFSHIYKVAINVYQASVPVVCIGEEYTHTQPLNLSYHLHEYGLGEHYNSLVPTNQDS